jgi:hypothetical protein
MYRIQILMLVAVLMLISAGFAVIVSNLYPYWLLLWISLVFAYALFYLIKKRGDSDPGFFIFSISCWPGLIVCDFYLWLREQYFPLFPSKRRAWGYAIYTTIYRWCRIHIYRETCVVISKDRFWDFADVMSLYPTYIIKPQIERWLNETCDKKWKFWESLSPPVSGMPDLNFMFKNESDAILFKLRWY